MRPLVRLKLENICRGWIGILIGGIFLSLDFEYCILSFYYIFFLISRYYSIDRD